MDEGMTDYRFKTFLKLILEMIRGSEDKEEAMRKIEELIGEGK